MGEKDISSKYLIDRDPEGWVRWLLGDPELEVVQMLSTDFQFVARYSDSLLEVRRDNERFAALAELQLYYENDMPERVHVYAALARQKFELDIVPIIVYMIPPGEGQEIVTAYHREYRGLVSHQDFHVIKLWELAAQEVLTGPLPASILPYVPLMAGANEETLRECVRRIREEPDREQLETILALFAMITMDERTVERVVRWSMTILEKSPIYREIWQKGHTEGIEEGVEKGLQEARRGVLHAVKRLLHRRLGTAPVDLPERLDRLSLEQLELLMVDAGTAAAWPEFLTCLADIEKG